jgi:hypothetical protein
MELIWDTIARERRMILTQDEPNMLKELKCIREELNEMKMPGSEEGK